MPSKSNPVGPTGGRAAATVAELRESEALTKTRLGDRLAAIGRPLSLDVLAKVENGTRPIDADDLVALALALDTTPNRLLLPGVADDSLVELTTTERTTAAKAWRWAADAEMPVGMWPPSSGQPTIGPEGHLRRHRFRLNDPHREQEPTGSELLNAEHRPAISRVGAALAAAAADTGLPASLIADLAKWRVQNGADSGS